MTVGVPTEIKAQENRVSMIPSYVSDLVKRGHRVVVQSGAGEGSAYANDQYLAAGADLVPDAKSVFQEAELIVKVKEPQDCEIEMLNEQHTLFTYLHLAATKPLTEKLVATGCTAIAYETISVNGHLPLLEPMSEIAGRMSSIVGSYHLASTSMIGRLFRSGVPEALVTEPEWRQISLIDSD